MTAGSDRMRKWREAHKDDPEYKRKCLEWSRNYKRRLRADPIRYKVQLEKIRANRKKYYDRKRRERTDLDKTCIICGKEFRASKSNQRVCFEEKCRKKARSIQTYAAFKRKREQARLETRIKERV